MSAQLWSYRKRMGREAGEREGVDLVLEQVWFPLDQRPGVGLFVQAERPRGEQRQPDVAPPSPATIEGVSAALPLSLSLSRPAISPSPLCIPPFQQPSVEQSPIGSSKLFTDVLCLCAIHESCSESSCQSPWPYCPGNAAFDMSLICEANPVFSPARLCLVGMQRQVCRSHGLGPGAAAVTRSF